MTLIFQCDTYTDNFENNVQNYHETFCKNNYGLKTIDLIGKPVRYVMAVIPKRISETLVRDDRITSVSDFEFDVSGNKLAVKFIVHSIYGDVEGETVVMY
jgi:hypothetical protein